MSTIYNENPVIYSTNKASGQPASAFYKALTASDAAFLSRSAAPSTSDDGGSSEEDDEDPIDEEEIFGAYTFACTASGVALIISRMSRLDPEHHGPRAPSGSRATRRRQAVPS